MKPQENLLSSSGGCCSYAKSYPVEALEIRLTLSRETVFLVQCFAVLFLSTGG
jgi:hypothetical protein